MIEGLMSNDIDWSCFYYLSRTVSRVRDVIVDQNLLATLHDLYILYG